MVRGHVHLRRWRHRARRGGRGSATVELACSLPALVLMVLVALGAVTAARSQLECVDAAREAARAAARGESGHVAAQRVAPPGSHVSVTVEEGTVRATVSVRVTIWRLPGFDVSSTAVAAVEPGAEESAGEQASPEASGAGE